MKVAGVYMIQSISKPERVYIGSSYYINMRKSQHLYDLRNNKHGNGRLQNHYNKYGKDDLVFSIIATCSREELMPVDGVIWVEQCFIWAYRPFFNISKTAGSTLGYKFTEEQRKRNSLSHMGQPGYWTNKSFSPEHRKNISISRMGSTPWNKGAEFSKEHRQHLSESHIGTNVKSIIQYDKSMNLIKIWGSIKEAAKELDIPRGRIAACLSDKSRAKSTGGFIWKYNFNSIV